MKKQLQIRVRTNPVPAWDTYLLNSIEWDKLHVIDVMYIFI